jgi:endoglucanase
MKVLIRFATIFLTFLYFCQPSFAQDKKTAKTERVYSWWNAPPMRETPKSPHAKNLPLISIRGSKFVDPRGDTILFRGLAISDPDKIESQGHWNKKLFMKVKEMGASLVRIPVHPVAWRERTPERYLSLLDQAVEWCTELGVYIIIDWHTIGNLKTELFQDPSYNTTKIETFEFWRSIAKHFTGNNTVAFYEIFNEPTLIFNQLGPMSWDEWKRINEDIIILIRAFDRETIPLVAGLDWAYDLTPLHINPVAAQGIGYVTHPYPHKRSKPWEPKWEEDFGFAAEQFPVVATEFGFILGKEGMADNGDYGNTIINYLEGKGISWVAWVFDPDWVPSMIKSWDTYALTECGEFFKQAMQDRPPSKK